MNIRRMALTALSIILVVAMLLPVILLMQERVRAEGVEVPTDGLVAYYPFNGSATDESGNGNNGSVYGATLTQDRLGQVDSAYTFDGVDDYIEVSDSPSLDITDAITIAAWVYIDAFNTNMPVVLKDAAGDPHVYDMVILSDAGEHWDWPNQGGLQPRKFGLELKLDGVFRSSMWSNTPLEVNRWYYLVATYDGALVKLYLNGQLDATYSMSGTIETSGSPLRIGNWREENSAFFNGRIDDVAVYNRALGADEIGSGPSETMWGDSLLVTPVSIPGSFGTNPAYLTPVLRFQFLGTGPLSSLYAIPPFPESSVNVPTYVVFNSDGELFVANCYGNIGGGVGSISRFTFDANGNFIPNGNITGNSLESVHGLAFSPTGELFAANWAIGSGTISRFLFDAGGNAVPNGIITTGSQNQGLAFSPTGELFCTHDSSVVSRFLFDPDTGEAEPNGSFSILGASDLHGLVFSEDSELFIADAGTNLVFRILFGSEDNPIDNGNISVPGGPIGVAFSAHGELFVTSHFSGGISRFVFDESGNAIPNGFTPTPTLGGVAVTSLDQLPSQPANVSPANAATSVNLAPTLQSSAFSDPDSGDTHAASQWRVTTSSSDYSSPIFDSGADGSDLTQVAIPSGILSYSTTYYWQVRYQDNHGAWSDWSVETSFTTTAPPNQPPNGQWVKLSDAPGYAVGAVYNSQDDQGVLLRGSASGEIQNTTWTWDGSNWFAIEVSQSPPYRVSAGQSAVAYDKLRDRVLLYGGWRESDYYYADFWEFENGQWNCISASNPPGSRHGHLAFDSDRNRLVLFGGNYYQTMYGDTWEWDGTAWSCVSTGGPAARWGHVMVYDEARQVVLLFGGEQGYWSSTKYGDTWAWDGSTWTELSDQGPAPRANHMMAYDPYRQKIILYGGGTWESGALFDDTWEWDGTQWVQVVIDGPNPGKMAFGSMFFDERLGCIVLVSETETWAYYPNQSPDQTPNQPSNVAPENEAANTSLTPTLQSSTFSDPDANDTHAASQWQITTTSGDYSSPVFNSSTNAINLTNITIPSGNLTYNLTYYWQVRYQDNHGAWSAWSAETSFTTAAPPNQPPNQPSNVGPEKGATDTSLTLTLQSSTFSDLDADDTHTASQWQITTTSGDYSSPVFNRSANAINLTNITIPSGNLTYNLTYYWQVRYQDNHGAWSAWSAETSFTTAAPPNQPPNQPNNLAPGNGTRDTSLTPTMQAIAFSDPDSGDTHTASQWQMTTTSGDYSSPVFDSGTEATSITSIAVPSDKLSPSTTYYWRVRYQDSHGDWSAWSAETSFTTLPSALLEEDSFIGSVPLPSEIPNDPGVVGSNLLLTLLFVLVFYFAATLFNSTLKENYGIIQVWFRRRSEWLRPIDQYIRERTSRLPSIRPKGSRYLYALLLVVISALIYCWLDPYFVFGLTGLVLFLSMAFSILIVTYGYEGTQAFLMVRRFRIPAEVKLYEVAALIAIICVFFSRIIDFHPGITYGFVGAFALLSAREPDRQQEAKTILFSAAVLLILSISAFHLRSLLPKESNDFWLLLVRGILTGVFVMGLEGLLFMLLPLAFMDGAKVAAWRKWVWVTVFSLALFFFIWYILHLDREIWEAAPNLEIIIMYGLMGVFLVVSGVFWLYFLWRRKHLQKQERE